MFFVVASVKVLRKKSNHFSSLKSPICCFVYCGQCDRLVVSLISVSVLRLHFSYFSKGVFKALLMSSSRYSSMFSIVSSIAASVSFSDVSTVSVPFSVVMFTRFKGNRDRHQLLYFLFLYDIVCHSRILLVLISRGEMKDLLRYEANSELDGRSQSFDCPNDS